ncbi:hypothetical protein [uncultured Ruminococcus sp.]|uniref:hypothetical protein n=1 Tax=uncultured Ruminococcus sp. TaxID=165186 RepID=UPI00261EE00B|nr:hypothetical protein [uncultured Ruminococcus sp.]
MRREAILGNGRNAAAPPDGRLILPLTLYYAETAKRYNENSYSTLLPVDCPVTIVSNV